jgi:hypothetical protein
MTSIMKPSDQLEPFPSLGQRTSPSPVDDDAPSKETIVKAADELENGLEVTIMQRLDAMEQRHQRIEDILLQLSQSISGIKASRS